MIRLFDWRPEKMRGDRAKHEKTVIIKNLFEPEMFDREVHLILDYQNDLREECGKCGTVRKVVVYDVSWLFITISNSMTVINSLLAASSGRNRTNHHGWRGGSWSLDTTDERSFLRSTETNSGNMGWKNKIQVNWYWLPQTACSLKKTLSFWCRIDESEADKTERLAKWQTYLENEDAKKEIAEKNQHTDAGADTSKSEETEIGSSWN